MAHLRNEFREFHNSNSFKQLIGFVPKKIVQELAKTYNADKGVRTLFAHKLLNLYILMNLLKPKYLSLRGIVGFSDNILFKWFTGIHSLSRSGLSDANNRVPSELFQDLLLTLMDFVKKPNKKLKHEFGKLKIFDTTLVVLSLKLFPWATYQTAKSGVKLGIRIDEGQGIPDELVIKPGKTNDNDFFKEMIRFDIKGITYIFDRGFQRMRTLDKIHDSQNFFITRMFPLYKYSVVKEFGVKKSKGDPIRIVKDQLIQPGSGKRSKYKPKNLFRLITAVNKQGEKLLFLTDRFDLTALDICELYKRRWQIEIFFKWLKQYLKIDKFVSHSENGVLIQIYTVLITHLLIVLYQRANGLKALSHLRTLRMMESQVINSCLLSMLVLGITIGLYESVRANICMPP